MSYNTINAHRAENLPPVTLDHQPGDPRPPGETLRAFLAFFQLSLGRSLWGEVEALRCLMPSGTTGSASVNSRASDATLSHISNWGVFRCALVYSGDLRSRDADRPRFHPLTELASAVRALIRFHQTHADGFRHRPFPPNGRKPFARPGRPGGSRRSNDRFPKT
jgi:hypothetical protein